MKFIALFGLFIFLASCQHTTDRGPSSAIGLTPRFTLNKLNSIANKHTLIITHASTQFDEARTAKDGVDQLVREFKAKGLPVVYLVNDQSPLGYQRWYTADRSPDFEIFSEGGEHNLPVHGNEITIVGGFVGSTDTLNGCQTLAMKDAIRMHFEVSKSPLTIHVPVKATYTFGEWSNIRESMLKSGWVDLKDIQFKYPFASLMFLRGGIYGDDGNEPFFAHNYSQHENKSYRQGEEVSREKYQFNFYINDKLLESVKDGPNKRIVNIRFKTK
ncbi:hypothetical protein [Bdellovibrio sp. HCB209]|uniref:hypothetical protein n=1 Tax=Bdellovibrio sp. HCB209 TaxID=3394354 RepID=UPI0039B3D447